MKGVAALIGSGTVEGTPEAVAAFLREHLADLDKGQLGEYLGHHEDFSVRFLSRSQSQAMQSCFSVGIYMRSQSCSMIFVDVLC